MRQEPVAPRARAPRLRRRGSDVQTGVREPRQRFLHPLDEVTSVK